MPNDAPVILLTRPVDQSQEFGALLGLDANVLVSPILTIQPVEHQFCIADYSMLIFSSQNAVFGLGEITDFGDISAIAVGDKTAKIANDLGIPTCSARGDSADLIKMVIQAAPKGKVLFIRGRHTRGKIAQMLNSAGIETDSTVVYDQVATPLSARALALFGGDGPIVIPLFSPRSAMLISDQLAEIPMTAPITLVAISSNVLKEWNGPSPEKIRVADQPTGPAMVKEILGLFDDRP